MQHPTIAVEDGNLKINDQKVFSLWLRLNEMAADDPVAAWAVAEIRALGWANADAIAKAQAASRDADRNVRTALAPLAALTLDLRKVAIDHGPALDLFFDWEVMK